ncbi:retrovirus-related pol polyprotein from transposon TNT 1-94, partial [Tanacetum coccineum]
ISNPTTALDAMNMALALMAKAFKLNYSTPTNNNQIISSNPQNRQIAQPGMNLGQDNQMQMVGGNGGNQFRQYAGQNVGNQVVQNAVQNPGVQNVGNQNGVIVVPGIAHQNGNGNVVAARAEGNANGNNGNQIRCYNCRGLGHLARNCTVRPRRRDAAYLQTQLLIAQKEEAGIQLQAEEFDLMAAAADLDEIEEVNANCILMANLQQASTSGTQTDKAPVYDSDGSAEVQLHDKCYNDEIFNMFTQEEQYTELLEPIPEPHQVPQNDSNVISKVSSVEQGGGTVEQHPVTVEETRAYQESSLLNLVAEVEKVNMSVYQEQCLTKKINALHLSSGKQITALNEEISNLNKQLSKEKSIVSSLLEEKKRLKSDFKIHKDELLDKQVQLENKIKELDNILVKTEAAKFVRDFQSLANEADESLAKHKALELEIERLLRAVVSQDIMCIVQNNSVIDTLNLRTELDQCKYDKISYDKAYNDMQQKIERLQAQLGDQKGKSKDTPCESNTLDPLPQKLKNKNVELEFQVSEQKDTSKSTSSNTKFANQSTKRKPFLQSLRNQFVVRQPNAFQSKRQKISKTRIPQMVDKMHDLSNPVISNSVPTANDSKVIDNDKVIAPGMFRINPFKNSREEKFVPNKPTKASVRTNPITVPQPHVIIKKVVNSDSNGFSSTGIDITTKTRRPQPRSNTKNDRVPSVSKSSRIMNKEVEVEDHPRNLLLFKNKKHMLSKCNNIKLAIRNDKSKIVYAMCKQCLITANHDACVLNYVNGMNSHRKKQKANVSNIANQTKRYPNMFMVRRLGLFQAYDQESKASHQICLEVLGNRSLWVYFVEGLGHNLFSVWQFCDSDLEVTFRRNTCFIRNLEVVDLLKGNRTTNLYTINLHDMASASLICLMARATSTKSWLWHQRLSHLNSDTINDLARNDLVIGLQKFKYHKEHLCPSYEQRNSKRVSHPPKPVPNSKQMLHLLYMDLCGPMRIASINEKRYVLVIVDDYSCYTWVVFLRSKDEAPEEIKTFLKRITVLL